MEAAQLAGGGGQDHLRVRKVAGYCAAHLLQVGRRVDVAQHQFHPAAGRPREGAVVVLAVGGDDGQRTLAGWDGSAAAGTDAPEGFLEKSGMV